MSEKDTFQTGRQSATLPRYIIIKEHDTSWGVVDTLGISEHREQACEVIASRMSYQTACSMAYLFDHEWTVK